MGGAVEAVDIDEGAVVVFDDAEDSHGEGGSDVGICCGRWHLY